MFCPKCGAENLDENKFCRKCGRLLPHRAAWQQQSRDLSGQLIDGRYKIVAKLGSGGTGVVYKATRPWLEDSVAIKILHPRLAADPRAAERFRREAITAKKLKHNNVVALYDVGLVHGLPYILMELADGYSLRQIIRAYRRLPLDFVVTVAEQVASALQEAHGLGIVHRDIKPENVIAHKASDGWKIKVLDFGNAKLNDQSDLAITQDGSPMGTPHYMSPEQCRGEQIDRRSDVYSLGIVLYEMLCGSVPFTGPTASAIAICHVQETPPLPTSLNADIHPDVEAVIMRSLSKPRDERPATARAMWLDLKRAATNARLLESPGVTQASIAAPGVVPKFGGESVFNSDETVAFPPP